MIIQVYSDQDLSPRASEVIRSILDEKFPGREIKFRQWLGNSNCRVLVFGRGPAVLPANVDLVYTYSVAQIMSKANAATVLAAGIQQFLQEPEKVPFVGPLWTAGTEHIQRLLDPTKPTAIDIETSGNLGKTHIPEEVEILTVAFYQEGNAPIVLVGSSGNKTLAEHQIKSLKDILPKFEKAIYHNGKFDTRVLNRVLGVKLCVWFDTMLAHHVLNIAAGDHKLKTLARRYLGAPEWEADLSKYTKGGGHYELIPTDLLVQYNGWDVYWTYKLWQFLSPQIESDVSNQTAFEFEMQAAAFLLDVEAYGIPFDNEYAAEYAEELEILRDSNKNQMRYILGNVDYNPNSPVQVKNAFHELGMEISGTDAKKVLIPYREENQLTQLQNSFMDLHLKFKELDKRRGTYAVGWANASRKGRVHPTFLVHGTSTGRLSSTSPNAQNVPRDKTVRKIVRTHG